MTHSDNPASRFAPFEEDELDRDPNERVAQYSHAEMYIYFNGRPAEDEPYRKVRGQVRSIAEALARVFEVYILACADTNFRGELTFKVMLPPPTKNLGFICWENGPSW